MTSLVPTFQQSLLQPPAELSAAQRVWLTCAVVAAHVGAGWLVWQMAPEATVVAESESEPIAVTLIADEPVTQAVAPAEPRPPEAPARPQVAKPAPPVQRAQPPVLAAPRPAAPKDMQVPLAPPVTERRPVAPETPPVAPAAPSPQAAPTAPVTAAPAAQVARSAAQPKVLPSSAVRYLVEPMLVYPRASRELGEQGVVRLKVLVDEQGRPRDIEVARSSGYPRLDQQAVQAMKNARFQPHLEDGTPRTVWVLAPLTFNLED